jgi:hypothetical protein
MFANEAHYAVRTEPFDVLDWPAGLSMWFLSYALESDDYL